jgi:hypothetical protein
MTYASGATFKGCWQEGRRGTEAESAECPKTQ